MAFNIASLLENNPKAEEMSQASLSVENNNFVQQSGESPWKNSLQTSNFFKRW
uniref:Uncharacterized protein n=1 Tax=Parascaris univalens TaxID=6257 RepID=A0A915AXY2_PARUN